VFEGDFDGRRREEQDVAGDRKILIDALFDRPNPAYRAPSPDTIDRMVNGIAPFDGVTAALVTHNHPDHFDARGASVSRKPPRRRAGGTR
jgi:L-ascorbate metabolism protein UlaG (beta-lactamase superfamily)